MPIFGIFVLEFILVHAGLIPLIAASKESKSAKIVSLSLVSLIYVAFIGVAAAKFHNLQLLLTFFGIIVPRWTGFFTDSEAVRQQQISRSTESTVVFIFTILPIAMLSESQNPFGPALIVYFIVMGLLEGAAPLRKRLLDQSKRAGCIIAGLAFILVVAILSVGIFKTVIEPLFQK